MNQEKKDLVLKEAQKAGEPAISPELMVLDGYRVSIDSELKSEEFLMRMEGCPCFPRRDLSAITGQAKSGKTMLISIIMACCVRPKTEDMLLNVERIREEPLRIMWFDTEQSPHSTQNILANRVAKLVGKDFSEELFYVFNIRNAIVSDRFNLIAEAVEMFRPDLLIVDNIRDLVKDINDGVQAQMIIESLMRLAEEFNCHIMTVLHQNRSTDNRGLRGWLGTELMNKVYEVYACQKILGKPGEKPSFCVEQTHTRKYDIDSPIYYQVNDSGIPEAASEPRIQPRDAYGKFATYQTANPNVFNQDYIIHQETDGRDNWQWDFYKLFSDAIGKRSYAGYQDLMEKVKELSFIQYQRYLDKVFEAAESLKVIRRDKDKCGRVIVMLLSPSVSSPSTYPSPL